ncbi:MAG TPA: hypothetical protein VF855_10385 [Acidimicrobiales bacterium]
MTTLRHIVAAGALVCLTSLAACSGDDGGTAATTSAAPSPAATTTTTAAGPTTSTTAASVSTTTSTTVPDTTTVASSVAPATTKAPTTTARPGTRTSLAPGCPAQSGGLATLVIGTEGLEPQCLSIYPDQSLKVVNNAPGDAQLTFGDVYTTPVMGPGDFTTTEPVGTGLGRNKALTIVCTCYPDNQGTLLIAR